jgi:EmrB/QacA subfamily drug resistance transporter
VSLLAADRIAPGSDMEVSTGRDGPVGRQDLDRGRKRLVLIACILASTVAFLDSSVINVALPAIREDLGGGLQAQQWVVNGYLVTLGALLLVGGSLGDVYGQRRVFTIGIVGFGLASLACAVAPTIGFLIGARLVQGAGAALLVPMSLAVITSTFEREERGRAIGTWTAWSGIGVALGPLVGGELVDVSSWRWIFAINLPLLAVTLALVLHAVPEGKRDRERRLDLPGALLCSTALGALTFGLLRQPEQGWEGSSVWASLLASAILGAAFVAYELRVRQPMLPLRLFKRRNFSVGNLETLAMYAGLNLLFFYLVIYLQQVAGYSALEAGAALLPVTLVLLLLAGTFGRLADRFGPRAWMALGPLVSGLGLALLLRLDARVEFVTDVLPGIALFSLGLAMTVAPLTATVLGDVDEIEAGVASGVNNAVARVAGIVGIAVVGIAIAGQFASELDAELGGAELSPAAEQAVSDAEANPLAPPPVGGLPPAEAERVGSAAEDASVAGFRLGMGLAAALMVVAGLLGAVGIRNPLREVSSEDCAGGQLAGQPADAARRPEECGPPIITPGEVESVPA